MEDYYANEKNRLLRRFAPPASPRQLKLVQRGSRGGARNDIFLDFPQPDRIFDELSRSRGMMNTPQLAAQFLGVAIFDTARLAARSFIKPPGPTERSGAAFVVLHDEHGARFITTRKVLSES
jgi:hypothetical protein